MKLKLNLEENALDSMRRAVECFTQPKRPMEMKYCILHVVHAIELFLKGRLAREHTSLIFQRPMEARAPL